MKSISEIKNFEGKKVIVRVDWDVLVEGGEVKDGERVDASFPTIEYIVKNGGSAILISHFGRKGESNKPVFEYFKNKYTDFLGEIIFIEDPFSHEAREQINNLKTGEIAVIENIRKWPEEEKNDESFAKSLSSLGEIYVNDSFASTHRAHASVVGIPKFLPSYAGLYFEKEIRELSKVFNPEHPFLFILGGAKIETKLPLIEKFLKNADNIFVAGLLASEALKSEMEIMKDPKIMIPEGDLKALDINEKTLEILKSKIENSKFILWNGPVGYYEDGHDWGTKEIAKALAHAYENDTTVIVGGGDTLAAIKELNLQNKFTHLSLAGGAMLEFLASGTLPGIEALMN